MFRARVAALAQRYSDAPEKLQYQLGHLLATGTCAALEDAYGRWLVARQAARRRLAPPLTRLTDTYRIAANEDIAGYALSPLRARMGAAEASHQHLSEV